MAYNDKQKQIMRVVENLATDRRFHEVTLDEVAEAAGVGKGTIYRYFADKDELFFQVATSGFEELSELLQQKVLNNSSFTEKLLNACKLITEFFDDRRQLIQMMQTEANFIYWRNNKNRQQWLAKRKLLVNVVAGIFSEGIREGIVRCDVSAEVAAICFLGLLRTRARELQDFSQDMKSCELLVDMFVNGMCVTSGKLTVRETAVAEVDLIY